MAEVERESILTKAVATLPSSCRVSVDASILTNFNYYMKAKGSPPMWPEISDSTTGSIDMVYIPRSFVDGTAFALVAGIRRQMDDSLLFSAIDRCDPFREDVAAQEKSECGSMVIGSTHPSPA